MTIKISASRRYLFAILLTMVLVTGCDGQLRTEYGQSRGTAGDHSINGFGVLRRAYEKTGWATRDVRRLNNRLTNVDTIVWTPQQPNTLYNSATEWFDEWLSEEKRTLIYIVPDEGCERRYLEAAKQNAPVDQRLEYRRRIARIESDQLQSRLDEDQIPSNGWFVIERLPGETTLSVPIKNNDTVENQTGGDVAVSYKVVPFPDTPTGQTQVSPTVATKPSSSWFSYAPSSVTVDHAVLYKANDGSPIVVRVTSPEWGESQLIVVGSGSILSNFSLATSQGQAVAERLIAESGDTPGNAGFLTTDFRGALVSEVDPEINTLTGMELLTVWPLNLIILNLAVLGFIGCMILLPIFGRPRIVESKSTSDFADHLDAVAALMQRSGGEDFAKRRISDYMKRIRGETVGPWVLPDSKTTTPSSMVQPETTIAALPLEPATSATKEVL